MHELPKKKKEKLSLTSGNGKKQKHGEEKTKCRGDRSSSKTEAFQGEGVRKDSHLSSFRLILDILCGADLGFDVLEVGQWLVDDAELLRCGRRRFGRGADHGHLPLLTNQTKRTWSPGGP